MTMKKISISFFVGVALGAGIWWLSPYIAGTIEPWDAENFFYPIALSTAGIIAALFGPKRFLVSVLGIYIGQFLYALIFLPSGPLWIIGAICGAAYLLYSLFGGFTVYICWRIIQKFNKSSPSRFT